MTPTLTLEPEARAMVDSVFVIAIMMTTLSSVLGSTNLRGDYRQGSELYVSRRPFPDHRASSVSQRTPRCLQ